MKGPSAVILTLVFLFQVGVKTGVLAWYHLNKTYISQELCENRAMPEMHCDGKCILAQKLKKAEAKRQEEPVPITEINNEIAPCLIEANTKSISTYLLALYSNALPPHSMYDHTWSLRIFHPPQSV